MSCSCNIQTSKKEAQKYLYTDFVVFFIDVVYNTLSRITTIASRIFINNGQNSEQTCGN